MRIYSFNYIYIVIIDLLTVFCMILIFMTSIKLYKLKKSENTENMFLWLIIIGLFGLCFNTIIKIETPEKYDCRIPFWLYFLSMGLIICPLSARIWNIYEKFYLANKLKEVEKNLFKTLILFIIIPIFAGIVVFSIPSFINQIEWTTLEITHTNEGELVYWCPTNNSLQYSAPFFYL